VEQPASLIGALNSPHDKSADKQQSLETSLSRAEPKVRIQLPPPVSQANFCTATLAGCRFGRRRSSGYAREEPPPSPLLGRRGCIGESSSATQQGGMVPKYARL
jgi:hypothetical protein